MKRLEEENRELQQARVATSLGFRLSDVDSKRLKNEILIGKGGFKDVYECKLDNRSVAVAKIRGISTREEMSRRHLREVKTFALAAGHPNFIQLEGWTREGWLVLEYCPHTLKSIQSSLSFEQKMSCGLEICRGLAFLHRLGIVHGDMKPENIMMSSNGVAKLSDFGFSYDVNSSSVSMASQLGGTARYQAPELSALNQEQLCSIDARFKDLYALGGVLLFLFCGREPWEDEKKPYIESNRLVSFQKNEEAFLPEKQIAKLIDDNKENKEDVEKLCAIIRRCFKNQPETRGFARQVMCEIEDIIASKGSKNAPNQDSQKEMEAESLAGIIQQAGLGAPSREMLDMVIQGLEKQDKLDTIIQMLLTANQ
eukprot:TRINITY_DN8592_c0_g1_i1.p1 TRINITY_DN8592_c0_g1~~TRINITY_DN8592_c0_g1_i1.p1  ORF type:complete len:368 (-),score=99.23 TRINITY_DN8592_c0_g1_i1:34-1137(-)